jgi:hypothetical protein
MPTGSFRNYWQFWHKKGSLAAGDNPYFNTDQATATTKETTNWEKASTVPYDIQISSISLVLAPYALADIMLIYAPGSYVEVNVGNTRVYEQLAAYCVTGTGPLINFSLASAAAQQFATIGHPDPNSLFKIPTPIMVHANEAFSVNLHLVTGSTFNAACYVTVVLHSLRRDIAYDG